MILNSIYTHNGEQAHIDRDGKNKKKKKIK